MKKILISLIAVIFLSGCAGFKTNATLNMATDVAFTAAMAKYPESKPDVVAALQQLKRILAGPITYDDLLLEVNKRFGGEYSYVCLVLKNYIETDKPISETYLGLFDKYKADLIKNIDRLILIASM